MEVLFPVEAKDLNKYLRQQLLEAYLNDTTRARRMIADGAYARVEPKGDDAPLDVQELLMQERQAKRN